jgi:hypothetical protein
LSLDLDCSKGSAEVHRVGNFDFAPARLAPALRFCIDFKFQNAIYLIAVCACCMRVLAIFDWENGSKHLER